jgi:hypothetical protein
MLARTTRYAGKGTDMRILAAAVLVLAGAPLAAQEAQKQEGDKREQTVKPEDPNPSYDPENDAQKIGRQPGRDIGLDKRKIPEMLQEARERPYDTRGLRTCAQMRATLAELDRVLGPDIDAQKTETGLRLGNAANDVLWGSVIPFRGLVREATGAAAADRRYVAALVAGFTRRGYVKGMIAGKNCRA